MMNSFAPVILFCPFLCAFQYACLASVLANISVVQISLTNFWANPFNTLRQRQWFWLTISRTDDKPLSANQWWRSLLAICTTRPRWVKRFCLSDLKGDFKPKLTLTFLNTPTIWLMKGDNTSVNVSRESNRPKVLIPQSTHRLDFNYDACYMTPIRVIQVLGYTAIINMKVLCLWIRAQPQSYINLGKMHACNGDGSMDMVTDIT